MYSAIIVGTDGSETAQHAVDQAARLAQALGGHVHLVSAYEPLRGSTIQEAPAGAAKVWAIPPDAKVRAIVDEACAALRFKGIEVTPHAIARDPADALLEIAEQEHADLIVVGSRGMHGMARALGSVPNKVSHRARCSVLIVATDAPQRTAD